MEGVLGICEFYRYMRSLFIGWFDEGDYILVL